MPGSTPPRLEMSGVEKSFAGTRVLHGVDLSVQPGEIHGLLGQNGAGKTTLMKILGGVHAGYDGSIAIDGRPLHLGSPRRALEAGIGMIYQELSLVGRMTVAENLVLGLEPGRGIYSARRARSRARDLLAEVASDLPLDARVGSLSAGMQQRVEITKALSRGARVLVMDEPTARLSAPEREQLFEVVREVARGGTAIVFISHFLEEVLAVTDRLTILRNGRVVASGETASFDLVRMGSAMLGQELAREESRGLTHESHDADVVLELKRVSTGGRVHDVDLKLREGEILGVAGLVGSGRTRLARTLIGAEPIDSGALELRGEPIRFRDPRDARRHGVVLVAEDRRSQGLVHNQSAVSNLALMALDSDLSRWGVVRGAQRTRLATAKLTELDVQPPDGSLPAAAFSGGNQQKLLIGRALLARPQVLVADQPTAGVDVGSKAQIHRLLKGVATDGAAILVISDDIEELLALSDRIVVMHRGRIVGSGARQDLSRDELLEMMSSGGREMRAA